MTKCQTLTEQIKKNSSSGKKPIEEIKDELSSTIRLLTKANTQLLQHSKLLNKSQKEAVEQRLQDSEEILKQAREAILGN